MPLAIQYGMPLHEFWHGDLRLLTAYQKAYYRDTQYKAWWQGQYGYSGFSGAIYNGFSDKSKANPYKYPAYEDFTEDLFAKPKTKITKENLEHEFRQEQLQQQAWLHNLLNT